jgi:peptidoglycan/LPS O-acetylase OafA/YrhL
VLFAVGLASASYDLVEQPMLRVRERKRPAELQAALVRGHDEVAR